MFATKNYLPQTRRVGVEMFCLSSVITIHCVFQTVIDPVKLPSRVSAGTWKDTWIKYYIKRAF